MDFDLKQYEKIYKTEKFSKNGLTTNEVKIFENKYGRNCIKKRYKTSLVKRILNALFEPMILILLFAWLITFAVNLTNLLNNQTSDFFECIGIFISITVSVGLTVIMESKSEKAFELLEKYSSNTSVKVVRNNRQTVIDSSDVVVGDVLLFDAGDKIVADALILDADELESEESTLNGEVKPIMKKAYEGGVFLTRNMLFSGTYIKNGTAKCIALAVGENAQTGKIATNLQTETAVSAPLAEKLNALSKKISVFGAISAILVFILNLIRYSLLNTLNFTTVKDAFIESIILIVAAVPEGLPATVAISLALSVVKLAKSNAIIKKLVATETVGCISVICSDKTGTLTAGKMSVHAFETDKTYLPEKMQNENILMNVALNSTAILVSEHNEIKCRGNYTEQALLNALYLNKIELLNDLRNTYRITHRIPFSSKNKYMSTTVVQKGDEVTYYKGSFESISKLCNLSRDKINEIYENMQKYQKNAERILAFAHKNKNGFFYDGFCSIFDEIRSDVYESIVACKKAGISVKILTGDDKNTALAVAKKLAIAYSEYNVLTGAEVEKLDDESLARILPQITVIARSTPETKLRIVNVLKKSGNVVAVTGDGVNDAPAVKNADIGIAMGDGSDITKEASDIILLDNSFSVIVKAISFGRNIYRNFQRFIFFQLTVNFSAVALIVVCLLLGFKSPFSATQLLWINVIMDGPLALTLGLERRDENLLEEKPVKRTDSILSKKTLMRAIMHSTIIVSTIILQKIYNFLNVSILQTDTAIFCLFVLFQLFNSINAREIGSKSVLRLMGKNKLYSITLIASIIMQILITECFSVLFNTRALGFINWLKVIAVCFCITVFSEFYKLLYRIFVHTKIYKKISKRSKFA